MIKFYDFMYTVVFWFCEKKAWFVTATPEVWAVILYSASLFFLYHGMLLTIGGLLDFQIYFMTIKIFGISSLDEKISASLPFLAVMILNFWYFLKGQRWKAKAKEFSVDNEKNNKKFMSIFVSYVLFIYFSIIGGGYLYQSAMGII